MKLRRRAAASGLLLLAFAGLACTESAPAGDAAGGGSVTTARVPATSETGIEAETWELVMQTPRGPQENTLVLYRDADPPSGRFGEKSITPVIEGPVIKFPTQKETPMGTIDGEVTLLIDGDRISGGLTMLSGLMKGRSFAINGERVGKTSTEEATLQELDDTRESEMADD